MDYNKYLKELLTNRNMDFNQLKKLLSPNNDLLSNIKLLPDIEISSDLILEHRDKPIICLVDIDADGLTSGACLFDMLTKVLNCSNVKVMCNKRIHGRGITRYLMKEIEKLDYSPELIITADHGSDNENEYKELKEKYNCKIIVTDHHEVNYNSYPTSADAFINHKRQDSSFKQDICGCMTVYLLMLYCYSKLNNIDNHALLDNSLVIKYAIYPMVATITDVMDITSDVNRLIYKLGYKGLLLFKEHNTNLYRVINLILKKDLKTLTSKDIGFKIGPVLNTGNRLNIEEVILDCLISNENTEIIDSKINNIIDYNNKRKDILDGVVNKVIQEIDTKFKNDKVKVGIVENIKESINGTLCSRIGASAQIPVIMFSDSTDSDIIHGSCRSNISNYDILSDIKAIQNEYENIVVKAAGHKVACGVSIYKDKLDIFRDLINKKFILHTDLIYRNTNKYDIHVKLEDIEEVYKNLVVQLEPYGNNWEELTFKTTLEGSQFDCFSKNYGLVLYFTLKDRLLQGNIYNNVKNPYGDETSTSFDKNAMYSFIYNLSNGYNNNITLDIKHITRIDVF